MLNSYVLFCTFYLCMEPNVISHRAKLTAQLKQAFKEAVTLIGVEATKVISEPRMWEGFNDVRDIVDKGQLRAAQKIRFSLSKGAMEAEIQYNTEYAAPVHNGATIRYKNGNVRRITSRPFITIAIARVDVPGTIRKLTRSQS